ncbi:DUF721 domain-containing protein [soil metagenome]
MALEDLNGLIKGLEGQQSWQVQRQFRLVLQHWQSAVGFAVARQTRPISIQRSVLYVATATAVWAQTLSYERLKILRKLNHYQRQPLKNIRFSTAQWAQTNNLITADKESQQHPSYVGNVPSLPTVIAQTPDAAFQRWAIAIQQMQSTQALCPQCRCRCPEGELGRWAVCALCAAKQWH